MSSSESGMAGTDTADPIIAGGNGPTIGGRGVAYCMSGAGDDRIWNLGGGNTTYGDAGDDTPHPAPSHPQYRLWHMWHRTMQNAPLAVRPCSIRTVPSLFTV